MRETEFMGKPGIPRETFVDDSIVERMAREGGADKEIARADRNSTQIKFLPDISRLTNSNVIVHLVPVSEPVISE